MSTETTAPSGQVDRVVMPGLVELVSWLTDARQNPWNFSVSYHDAANRTLTKMVELGMIEGRHHPLTSSTRPTVFRVGGAMFGRIDGVDDSLFE